MLVVVCEFNAMAIVFKGVRDSALLYFLCSERDPPQAEARKGWLIVVTTLKDFDFAIFNPIDKSMFQGDPS